ncbi:hypothetical protein CREGCYN_12050 [Synechococcus sp. M16CYN]
MFEPSASFSANARIGSLEAYLSMAEAAKSDPDSFWGEVARNELHWFEPFHSVLDWSDAPLVRWSARLLALMRSALVMRYLRLTVEKSCGGFFVLRRPVQK